MPHEQTIATDRSTLYDTAHYAYVTGAPATHYPGCYRDPGHHACALAEIARLTKLAAQETPQTAQTDISNGVEI